ncbi:MAG: CoA transferase [Intrasporangium sp.]|uniref:CaiB/BaiF CoA transferase family protein n=1 Tax=Intrasporangium sp. TaxID=1925024 RepID=UPI002647A664|nr:CoA transferase [Intrasporangium sp.]MDN5796285.1 CoA transferase [Intrasporangium sp.]
MAGIVVADFSRVLAGPLATMTLADLGARVIKVERPGSGDDTRSWGPPFTEHGSTYFASVNRSKESVALDLRDPEGRAAARRLAERADVVIENFKPGTMARLGLAYEDLAPANPGLVYCSISGFGSAGGAGLLGYDFIVQAVGGLMSITGAAGGEPTKVGVALVDVLTGKDAVIGILAALAARARTGRGDRIEVTLLTSLLGGLANQAQAQLSVGIDPVPLGNRHPSIAPYETLHCADGLLAVACGNDEQFGRLSTALGLSWLCDDTRFATNAARVANRDELVAWLESVLTTAPAGYWAQTLTTAQVPAGQVGTIGGGIALAEELGLAPTVDLGPTHAPQVRHPVGWAAYETVRPTPPPELGEHTESVLAWLDEPQPARRRAPKRRNGGPAAPAPTDER